MIVSELLPKVYYEESRDFAYIGRVVEFALNYLKTGADIISAPLNTENIDSLLVELLTTTLGFESNPNYLTRDLVDIDSVFITALKKKGSLDSISLIIQTLLSSQEIMSDFAVEYKTTKSGSTVIYDYNEINIYLPSHTVDIMLLEKILDYILPAGMIYHIKPASTNLDPLGNNITTSDKIHTYKSPNPAASTKTGLPDMYTGKVYGGESDISEGPIPTTGGYAGDTNNQRSLTSFGVVVTDSTTYSNDNE